MLLLNGDCLDLLKELPDESIDLVFCDLPYVDSKGKGQTSCAWNQSAIDLSSLWAELLRVKKLKTPLFFTTTTKFGIELLNSSPKKLKFFDLVWIKSTSSGFLLSKKFPLRKHEMIYVFYEKLPFYDLSSHKHKFIKNKEEPIIKDTKFGTNTYNTEKRKKPLVRMSNEAVYNPPLPVSVIKEDYQTLYNDKSTPITKHPVKGETTGQPRYDPPLPVSVIKEPELRPEYQTDSELYGDIKRSDFKRKGGESMYSPPLPNSILEIKSTRGKHSTEKPVELISWILKYYSKEGDVILDPTMGSGSAGVAAKQMNRDFVGFEKDEEIFEFAVQRIEEA